MKISIRQWREASINVHTRSLTLVKFIRKCLHMMTSTCVFSQMVKLQSKSFYGIEISFWLQLKLLWCIMLHEIWLSTKNKIVNGSCFLYQISDNINWSYVEDYALFNSTILSHLRYLIDVDWWNLDIASHVISTSSHNRYNDESDTISFAGPLQFIFHATNQLERICE